MWRWYKEHEIFANNFMKNVRNKKYNHWMVDDTDMRFMDYMQSSKQTVKRKHSHKILIKFEDSRMYESVTFCLPSLTGSRPVWSPQRPHRYPSRSNTQQWMSVIKERHKNSSIYLATYTPRLKLVIIFSIASSTALRIMHQSVQLFFPNLIPSNYTSAVLCVLCHLWNISMLSYNVNMMNIIMLNITF